MTNDLTTDSKFFLDRLVIAKSTAIEITAEEFDDLRVARVRLRNGIEAEEAFSVLLANYVELKADLLVGALRSRTYALVDMEEFREGVILVHRRLASFLSSGRAYLDQLDRLLCEHFGKSSAERSRFRAARNREYDGRIGYRFLEELRNHAQHRGRSVHGVTHSFWLDGDRETGVRKNALVPTVSTERLRAEKFGKRKILNELDADGKPVELMPLVDDYMEGLGGIHLEVRDMLKEEVDEAIRLYQEMLTRYEAMGEGILGLAAVERKGRVVVGKEIPITEHWMDLHEMLVRRTPHLTHFVGAVTTNESKQ